MAKPSKPSKRSHHAAPQHSAQAPTRGRRGSGEQSCSVRVKSPTYPARTVSVRAKPGDATLRKCLSWRDKLFKTTKGKR